MSKRDKRGRYTRTYREATRFDTFLFVSILGGILFGIVFDVVNKPHVFEVHTVEAAEEVVPQEVMIEVQYNWTPERIEQEIREVFPEDSETAIKIAKCESGLRAKVQSQHVVNGQQEQSFGVMQIHSPSWHKIAMRLGFDEYKTNPKDNIAMARHIYDNAGKKWTDWSCYTKKMI